MALKSFLFSSAALIVASSTIVPAARAQNDLDALLGELTYGDSNTPAKEFAQEALTLPQPATRQLTQQNQSSAEGAKDDLQQLGPAQALPRPIEAGPTDRQSIDALPERMIPNGGPPVGIPSVENNSFSLPPDTSTRPLTNQNVQVPSPITQSEPYAPPATLTPMPLPQANQQNTNFNAHQGHAPAQGHSNIQGLPAVPGQFHASGQNQGCTSCASGNGGIAGCDSGGCASGRCAAPRYAQRPQQPWMCEPHRRPNLPGPKTLMQNFQASNCEANVWEGYHQEAQARCERCHKHIHGQCDCYAKEMAKRAHFQRTGCADQGCSNGTCQQRGCTTCN